MVKKDTSINLKKRLKNTNAKLKRRDNKIAAHPTNPVE